MAKAQPRRVTPPTYVIPPEHAEVLERIREPLLAVDPPSLFEAALAAQIGVAESFDRKGVRSGVVGVADKWPDGAAIAAALRDRAPEILEVSPWILEVVDRQKAADESVAICLLPRGRERLTPYEENEHFDQLLRQRASIVVNRNAALLPVDAILAVATVGEILCTLSNNKYLDAHPALQTGASILSALRRTQWFVAPPPGDDWARDQGLADYFLKRLVELRYSPAIPVLEELFRTTIHRVRWEAAPALEALGSRLPREALIAAAEDGTIETDATWEPLRERAIRAVFEADPRTAYDRLGRYLEKPELTDGGPRRVMDLIVAELTRGKQGPGGFVYISKKSGFYGADPRWGALIERMAHDPLWERVSWTFEKLTEAERWRRLMAWDRRRRRQAAKPATKAMAKAKVKTKPKTNAKPTAKKAPRR